MHRLCGKGLFCVQRGPGDLQDHGGGGGPAEPTVTTKCISGNCSVHFGGLGDRQCLNVKEGE